MKRIIILLLAVFLAVPLVSHGAGSMGGWSTIPMDGGSVNAPQTPVSIDLPALKYVNNYILVANVAQSVTPPTWATYVLFSATVLPVYYNFQGAAVVPSVSITDGTGSMPNLGARIALEGATSISFISPYAGVLGVAFGK